MPKKKKTYKPGERRPAGMQLDGRYRGKIKVGVDANGDDVYKYASGRTKAELAANLEELRKEYIFGIEKVDRDVLLVTFAESWYAAYIKPHVSVSNWKCYRSILDAHILPAFAGKQIRSVLPADAQNFLNGLAGHRKSYIKKIHMIIRQIFKRALVDGVIDRDPTLLLKMPEGTRQDRRALTAAERKVILALGNREPAAILLPLLFYTGARPGEALGLRWGDIDFKRNTIHIQRDIDFTKTKDGEIGELKTPQSNRFIPMPKELSALLRARRGFPNEHIVQSPVSGSWLRSTEYELLWDRLMQAAYLLDPTIEHRDSDHSHAKKKENRLQRSVLVAYNLRHNYASMLHAKKVDVLQASQWMGHKDAATTLRIYTHLDKEIDDADASLLDGVFDGVK